MNLVIRRADLSSDTDVSAIVTMTQTYASDPNALGRPLGPDVEARLPEALRAHPGLVILLAWNDERPVGIAHCVLSFSSFRAAPVLNIHDLAVAPSERGRGVGKQLLEAVADTGRKLGCCKVTLEVSPKNPARAFYESTGFAVTSHFMERDLDETGNPWAKDR
ncbi:MAG TPA: GNAT family N-acetyltransferase [Fimbriimonadaceae bacterium]|nr:GNAT family N-acetyltransferase [Fimbriimonadaceae bacterium]